jgi:hypothetical protein
LKMVTGGLPGASSARRSIALLVSTPLKMMVLVSRPALKWAAKAVARTLLSRE